MEIPERGQNRAVKVRAAVGFRHAIMKLGHELEGEFELVGRVEEAGHEQSGARRAAPGRPTLRMTSNGSGRLVFAFTKLRCGKRLRAWH